ncbi:vesicle-associated membrane protein 726 [Euphorbia peplus]|nr:vesicle-associated membrane protein 726 [Euphorbia peplus]
MRQQLLIYNFIARGTVILADYTEFTGNFTSIVAQCLQKLPATNNKFTYNCDGHTFNYLVDNGFNNKGGLYHNYLYQEVAKCALNLTNEPAGSVDMDFQVKTDCPNLV